MNRVRGLFFTPNNYSIHATVIGHCYKGAIHSASKKPGK